MSITLKSDCRFFVGSKPCAKNPNCLSCNHYQPIKNRILIFKLGALGDLARTTCILQPLVKEFPNSAITWVTLESGVELLRHIPEIHQILTIDGPSNRGGPHLASILQAQNWDLILNFDKDAPAPHLATLTPGNRKRGFGINEYGKLKSLNQASDYALALGVSDQLKFYENKKTYQSICLEMAELPLTTKPSPYRIVLTLEELQWATKLRNSWIQNLAPFQHNSPTSPAGHIATPLVGVNLGSADTFATKRWGTEKFAELCVKLSHSQLAVPVLLGGEREKDTLDTVSQILRSKNALFLRPGENYSLRQFAALFHALDGVVTGDTLGMHLALAAKKKTIILFTSTSATEIEGYGLTEKIIGKADCAPCYRQTCVYAVQTCSESIRVDQVLNTISEHLLRSTENSEKEAA